MNNSDRYLRPASLAPTELSVEIRLAHAAEICRYVERVLKVKDLYSHVVNTNPNPHRSDIYHSTQHILYMTSLAYSIFMQETFEAKANKHGIIFDTDVALLSLAAMFHDYGHTLGKEKDIVNIAIAQQAARSYMTDNARAQHIDEVESIIKITEYPFVFEPTEIIHKCIRDADIIYGLVSVPILLGLCAEFGFPIDGLLSNRIAFMANAEIFTTTGLEYVGKLYPKHLNDLLSYLHSEEMKSFGGYV